MHLDVHDLRNFYYRSTLGRAAQKVVRDQVRLWWPQTKGQTVVGFGFAAPLLRPFLGEARRVTALMPGPQGVMPWPAGMRNVAVLSEEMNWPIDTGSVDKLVLMHGLETSENPTAVLDECFRVLGPGGSVMFVVPNRAGLWSRSDRTPFGYGRPYSAGQLDAQLRRHAFSPERHVSALYRPPSDKRFWRKFGPVWESSGRRIVPYLAGGVLMVEATKQVYSPTRPGLPEAISRPLGVLEGIAKPVPKPAHSQTSGRRSG